jgi:D-glycero-alpha-D-manno-heptose-7-phosphate kinase
MLFYTGITRSADTILAEQTANIKTTGTQLDQLQELAGYAVDRLSHGDIDAIGPAIRESWEAKRKLASGVSNERVEAAIAAALDAGATGVKLTGAGGGGFLLVICPMERQRAVRDRLCEMRELPVKLDRLGTRVMFSVQRDIWS